jgi:hypothetical protein
MLRLVAGSLQKVDPPFVFNPSAWGVELPELSIQFCRFFVLTGLRETLTIIHYPVYTKKMKSIVSTLVFFSLLGSAYASTITQAASRTFLEGLGPSVVAQWGTALNDETVQASGYTVTSSPGGIDVTATISTGDSTFMIVVEGGALFNGNFAPGDVALFSNFNPSPFSLAFSAPIQGIGFQIQALANVGFTATLTAFGAGNANFGSVSTTGISSIGNGDNTAPFLGFYATVADIVSVVISVTPDDPQQATDFAINRATILTSLDEVPEPATLSLVGLTVGLLAWLRRRA